jgi:hypothetical protein
MSSPRAALLGLTAVLATATPARPQQSQGLGGSRYDYMYGEPVEVTLYDLVNNPEAYTGRAIRTSGRLDLYIQPGQSSVGRTYVLRDSLTVSALLVPVPEVAVEFESEGFRWLGKSLEVTGVFQRAAGEVVGTGGPAGVIQFWSYIGPPDPEDEKKALKAPELTLESLLATPGKRDGQTVRVVGKFRGHNLYGDLPISSRADSKDWVIKDDVYAVWVTGKKPKGSGWELDASLKRDTGKWVEVVGRVETRRGITYIRAVRVALSTQPRPQADAQPPPPPPEKPKAPPVVVFALPLDGEHEVPSDSQFVVQFNKDMDESTFKGRIRLRYVGPRQPGDREFDGIRLSYDGGRRALTVDPGDVLRQGRQLELLLLPGIADVEGLPLEARPGKSLDGAVDFLRFYVGT